MLTFLSSVCSVSSEAATASRAGLRKHWKGVVRFISPLLVNLISSLAIVINRNTVWLSERRCFATQTGYIYEWTWERSVTKQCSRFFIIRHIHNHTSIISSEMQVELKKNTAFTWGKGGEKNYPQTMLLGEYSVRTGKTPQQHKSTYTT